MGIKLLIKFSVLKFKDPLELEGQLLLKVFVFSQQL